MTDAAPGPATAPAPAPPPTPAARGVEWWLVVLRGALSILFGVLVFVFPLAGILVVIAMLAAWFLIDGAFALWHAASGPRPEDGRGWLIFNGIVGVVAGAAMLALPGLSALTLVYVAAAWSLISGVTHVAEAFQGKRRFGPPWLLGLAGVVGIIVGVLLILAPGPGLLALIWMIGIQAVILGAALVAIGLRLRRGPVPGLSAPRT